MRRIGEGKKAIQYSIVQYGLLLSLLLSLPLIVSSTGTRMISCRGRSIRGAGQYSS